MSDKEMDNTIEEVLDDEFARKAKKKKIKKIITFSVIGVLAAVVVGVLIFAKINADDRMPLETVVVERGDLEQILSSSGTVESEEVKTYYGDVEAPIKNLSVKEGEAIRKGDILVEYDTTDLELEKQKALLDKDIKNLELQVRKEKGDKEALEYAVAVNNLVAIDQEIARVESEIDQIYCQMANNSRWTETSGSEINDEIAKLEEKRADAKVEIEKIEAGKKKRSDEKKKLKKKVDKYENEIDEKKEELRGHFNTDLEEYLRQKERELADLKELKADNEAERDGSKEAILTPTEKTQINKEKELAEVSAEKFDVDLAKAGLGVVADFDGIVTDVKVSNGAYVSGGTELFTVQNDKAVKVSMKVTRFDLEYIAVGQTAKLIIAGHEYTGKITHIDKAASLNEAGVSIINADIHIDNPDDYIYLGVEAKATINVASVSDAMLLPVDAVNMDDTGYYCYVIRNDVVERANVKIGISSESMTEILEGLKDGDVVVNDVNAEITEGMRAKSMETDDSSAQEELDDKSESKAASENSVSGN